MRTNISPTGDSHSHAGLEWLTGVYAEQLVAQITSAREDLNNATSLAITGITVVLGIVLTTMNFQSISALILLFSLLLVLTHFATRAIKAYLNMVRFSLILRRLTEFHLGFKATPLSVEEAIWKYHVAWYSPMDKRTALKKVIVEFGFSYFFLLIAGLILFSIVGLGGTTEVIVVTLVGMIFWLFEWYLLFTSVYFKRIEPGVEIPEMLQGKASS